MNHYKLPFALLMVLAAMISTSAQAARIGDPAARLEAAKWVKGKPVSLASGKGREIYVLEFWATWCGPCLQSIPHLTRLQEKYADKGVTIIGISTESLDVIEPFVRSMGSKMNYTVMADRNRKTSAAYMGAYRQSDIPTAFVVNKQGNVVWYGHPMGELDKVLEHLLSDTTGAGISIPDSFQKNSSMGISYNVRKLSKEEAEILNRGDAAAKKQLLSSFAGGSEVSAGVDPRYEAEFAERRKSYADRLKLPAQASPKKSQSKAPAESDAKRQDLIGNMLMDPAMDPFLSGVPSKFSEAIILAAEGKKSESGRLLRQIEILAKDEYEIKGMVAWMMVLQFKAEQLELGPILRMARAGHDGAAGFDPVYTAAYARAKYYNGQAEDAVGLQKEAIKHSKSLDADYQAAFKESLAEYEAAAKTKP